jgi:anthranilate phosphoribosyltransferase
MRLQILPICVGSTVGESAAIFNSILECRGTKAQNNVVLANTQLAIKCCFPLKSLEECRAMAEDSLFSRKASGAFIRLIELQP